MKPEIAVVSTNSIDPDGPYIETIDRLREAGAKVYQTGRFGMVTVISDGNGYRVLTERVPGQATVTARETPASTATPALPREMPACTAATL